MTYPLGQLLFKRLSLLFDLLEQQAKSVRAPRTAKIYGRCELTTRVVLLPGTGYTSAGTFVSSGSAAALAAVKNLDGTTTNLVFDVHKYLDSDNSGTHAECVTNNIDDAFSPLATWLRSNGRQALNTETGGGNVASCETYLCQQIAYLKYVNPKISGNFRTDFICSANSDVYLGYLGWSAGSFDSTYSKYFGSLFIASC